MKKLTISVHTCTNPTWILYLHTTRHQKIKMLYNKIALRNRKAGTAAGKPISFQWSFPGREWKSILLICTLSTLHTLICLTYVNMYLIVSMLQNLSLSVKLGFQSSCTTMSALRLASLTIGKCLSDNLRLNLSLKFKNKCWKTTCKDGKICCHTCRFGMPLQLHVLGIHGMFCPLLCMVVLDILDIMRSKNLLLIITTELSSFMPRGLNSDYTLTTMPLDNSYS